MARNPISPSNVTVAVIVAVALFIVAIIVGNFWLSLILGVAGAGTFAYALLLLRQYRKALPNGERGAR